MGWIAEARQAGKRKKQERPVVDASKEPAVGEGDAETQVEEETLFCYDTKGGADAHPAQDAPLVKKKKRKACAVKAADAGAEAGDLEIEAQEAVPRKKKKKRHVDEEEVVEAEAAGAEAGDLEIEAQEAVPRKKKKKRHVDEEEVVEA